MILPSFTPLRELTQDQYFALPLYPGAGVSPWHDEQSWLITADNSVVGVLIRDRVDLDWSWVVMTPDAHGVSCCVDLAVSHPSSGEARAALERAMWHTHREQTNGAREKAQAPPTTDPKGATDA